MKKFLLTIIFSICILLGANAINSTVYVNDALNNNVQEVIVNVPSNIYFYKGNDFGINIRTINNDLCNRIKYEIKGDKLYIDFKDHILRENDAIEPQDIKINIQTPNEIKNIKTNSSYLLVAKTQKHNATNNGKN